MWTLQQLLASPGKNGNDRRSANDSFLCQTDGERFSVGMTAKVLKGSRDKKIRDFKLNSISTYGILSAYTEKELTGWIHFLIAEQILATEEGKFPTLKLNKNSIDVLKGERAVWM